MHGIRNSSRFTWRQRLSAMLHGGTDRRARRLAVMLGLLAGCSVGGNATLAVVLLLTALLNVSTQLWLATLVATATGAWLLEPLTERLGYIILDLTPLGRFLGGFDDNLWLALFDFDRYDLVGGLAVVAVLGGPIATLVARFAPRPIAETPSVGLLRPAAWLAVPLTLLLAMALPYYVGSQWLAQRLLGTLSQFHGAPVTAARASLRLDTGELEFDRVHVAAASEVACNVLRIEKVRALVRPAALVRGRLEIELLWLSGIDRDVLRLDASALPKLNADMSQAGEIPVRLAAESEYGVALHDCVRGMRTLGLRLPALGETLAVLEQLGQLETAASRQPISSLLVSNKYRRSPLGRERPLVRIGHATIEGLAETWNLGPGAVVELAELSSDARPGQGSTLSITLPQQAAELHAQLWLGDCSPRHEVELRIGEMPAMDLIEPASEDMRLAVARGKVQVSGRGWMTREQFAVELRVKAHELSARVLGDRPLAGLAPKLWNDGLALLPNVEADLDLEGSWYEPCLWLDSRRLRGRITQQLALLGQASLLATDAPTGSATTALQKEIATAAPSAPVEVAIEASIPTADHGSPIESSSASTASDAIPTAAEEPVAGESIAAAAMASPGELALATDEQDVPTSRNPLRAPPPAAPRGVTLAAATDSAAPMATASDSLFEPPPVGVAGPDPRPTPKAPVANPPAKAPAKAAIVPTWQPPAAAASTPYAPPKASTMVYQPPTTSPSATSSPPSLGLPAPRVKTPTVAPSLATNNAAPVASNPTPAATPAASPTAVAPLVTAPVATAPVAATPASPVVAAPVAAAPPVAAPAATAPTAQPQAVAKTALLPSWGSQAPNPLPRSTTPAQPVSVGLPASSALRVGSTTNLPGPINLQQGGDDFDTVLAHSRAVKSSDPTPVKPHSRGPGLMQEGETPTKAHWPPFGAKNLSAYKSKKGVASSDKKNDPKSKTLLGRWTKQDKPDTEVAASKPVDKPVAPAAKPADTNQLQAEKPAWYQTLFR